MTKFLSRWIICSIIYLVSDVRQYHSRWRNYDTASSVSVQNRSTIYYWRCCCDDPTSGPTTFERTVWRSWWSCQSFQMIYGWFVVVVHEGAPTLLLIFKTKEDDLNDHFFKLPFLFLYRSSTPRSNIEFINGQQFFQQNISAATLILFIYSCHKEIIFSFSSVLSKYDCQNYVFNLIIYFYKASLKTKQEKRFNFG